MPMQSGRYTAEAGPSAAAGWTLERITPPSQLAGANGMRIGPDGRLYVAQVSGSAVSAVDIDTGLVEAVSPLGGPLVGPDDLDFGPDGAIYATEVMNARVGVRAADGTARVLRDDLPFVNGISFHRGRLFVDECREGGRLMELPLDGGAPKVLLADIPSPNALQHGPDGKIYFPVMGANAIWRIDPAGGDAEVVAGDLGVPDAVKFDAEGFIVSTQVATGEVLRIDPRSGDRTVLATIEPGLDNCVFAGDRLFVSDFRGAITEVLGGGATRPLLKGGFNGPFGIAMADDGVLYVADGPMTIALSGGERRTAGMLFTPGFPGYSRGLAAVGGGEFVVATSSGTVARWWPAELRSETIATGLDQAYGVALAPDGTVYAADLGAGRVVSIRAGTVETVAAGLDRPIDVAIAPDGACLIAEAGRGRIARVVRGGVETLIDGLVRPHGLVVRGTHLFVVDAGAKTVVDHDLDTATQSVIARDLPVGPPPGVSPKPLLGFPPLSGPMGPFAALCAGPDGTLYLSADGDGSVIALRPA